MKKKYIITLVSVLLSSALFACANPNSAEKTEESQEISTEFDTEAETEKDSLLSFGFTPEEFVEDFANFASFSGTYINKAEEVVPLSWIIFVDNPDGDDLSISLLCNSDGKVANIDIDDTENPKFVDAAKAAISASDIHFNVDKVESDLDLANLPATLDDAKTLTQHGIALLLLPDRFIIQRDSDNASDYDYIEIQSNSKAEAENISKTSNASNKSSSSDTTLGQNNALSSAKSYLNTMAFSYTGLIEQLEFEGYTVEEATYAADNCGADWNEQATKSAQSYLDAMSFSRDGLIDQLLYEGFTQEQAEYGVSSVGY